MLKLDRIHKPRKPTDVRDKKQAPVLHGCCPHVRHTSNVYVEGLPALPSAIHYSIFPMPPDAVGDPHGPPRVIAPHTAMPCCDRMCGCWSVTRSVKTEPEPYQ